MRRNTSWLIIFSFLMIFFTGQLCAGWEGGENDDDGDGRIEQEEEEGDRNEEDN